MHVDISAAFIIGALGGAPMITGVGERKFAGIHIYFGHIQLSS